MRRAFILILVTAIFIFALNGFKTVEHRAVEVVACRLAGTDAFFRLVPKAYQPGLVTLNVKIYEDKGIAALGSRKVELLQLPEQGIVFRVPLTGNLSIHRTYKVLVALPGNDAKTVTLTWANVAVQPNSSSGFFSRDFNPIDEMSEVRNQFRIAGIRTSLH
ncbi:MAG: hypothetical protein KKB51_12855 [Candidatus Riflebacteria bacterium]|nr:hypothetical protein [Candidatus Riflebacteria bacterium]